MLWARQCLSLLGGRGSCPVGTYICVGNLSGDVGSSAASALASSQPEENGLLVLFLQPVDWMQTTADVLPAFPVGSVSIVNEDNGICLLGVLELGVWRWMTRGIRR